jgi:hypothetical protein
LPWDGAGHYSRDRIEFYYQSHAAPAYPPEVLEARVMQGYGGDAVEEGAGDRKEPWQKPSIDPRDQKMVRIDESKTLGEVLAEEACVVPGHPIVYVVAKGTAFREKFLAGEWEL